MTKRFVIALVLLAFAAPAHGQSLYNSAGLGLPAEPTDGRARALGSLGIGLWGAYVNQNDPAAAGMLLVPSAVMVAQPSWVEFDETAGESGRFQGTRFPMIGVGYPSLGGTVSVTFGSFLDQRFESTKEIALDGGNTATDLFRQRGAVSQVTLGYARRLGESAAWGLNIGRYAGSLTRNLQRDFGPVISASSVLPYQTGGRWGYSGTALTGGVLADVGTFARVSASVTLSSSLKATATDDTEGADGTFDLPIQYRLGASAVLAPGLRAAASIVRADWSEIADDLVVPSAVGGTSGFGFGLELSRARLLGKEAPLRFGYRKNDLPFSFGTSSASESAWAGGFGLVLNQADQIVLAGVDLALERGTRSDSVLKESFWRATLSLRVAGF